MSSANGSAEAHKDDYALYTPTPERYACARFDCDKQAQTVWVHWFEALNGPTVAFYGACEDHRRGESL